MSCFNATNEDDGVYIIVRALVLALAERLVGLLRTSFESNSIICAAPQRVVRLIKRWVRKGGKLSPE